MIKFKIWFNIFINYFTILNNSKKSFSSRSNLKNIFFDLKDFRQEPYYFPIIFSFHEAGYSIKIANRIRFIGHSFGSGRFIYELPNVSISNNKRKDRELLLTDSNDIFHNSNGWKKKILLKPYNHQSCKCKSTILPYPMHPNAYRYGYYKNLEVLRSNPKKCRILFSGNTDPEAYQNPVIHSRYYKLNRIEVINSLLKCLNSNSIIVVKEKEDQVALQNTYFNGLVLYLWQWSPKQSQGLDIRVPNDKWLDFLAVSDFFLCCSGVVIPQSHNAIEAMSVGAIPILQYAELFHPALIHHDNCIIFSDEKDLIEKINEVFQLSITEIKRMRENVIDYYEKYLHHTYVASLVEELPNNEHEIYFYNEAS